MGSSSTRKISASIGPNHGRRPSSSPWEVGLSDLDCQSFAYIILDSTEAHSKTCWELIKTHLPTEDPLLITIHGGNTDRGATRLVMSEIDTIRTNPTVLFADCCNGKTPVEFRAFKPTEEASIPDLLVSTYSRAQELVKTTQKKENYSYQAIYFSRVALHLVVNLRDALKNGKRDPNKVDRCLTLDK
ncbi:hypothetical protein CPB86DRAFT_830721 [Serendipita vermifera]|nr:hypothetical protein CPB86DRAFT_830721 [Serendipita vermifera]